MITNASGSSNLLSLPDDILLEILALLTALEVTRCSSLCRRLQRLSFTRIIWLRILDNGNTGYTAFVPPDTLSRSTPTQDLRRLLWRAELTERQWAGLIPKQTPKMHWLGSLSDNMNRICGYMGRFYVSLDIRSQDNPATFRWYPQPTGQVGPGEETEHAFVYRLGTPYHEFRPFDPSSNLDARVVDDSLFIVYARRTHGKARAKLYITRVQLVDNEIRHSTESLGLPSELRMGVIRWLDDDHVVILEWNQSPTGRLLLASKRTKRVMMLPTHRSHINMQGLPSQITGRRVKFDALRFFVTHSYFIHIASSKDYEVFELPSAQAGRTQNNGDPEVLYPKRPSFSGQFPFQFHKIWYIQEHLPSTLTVVGIKRCQTESQIVLLKHDLHSPSPPSVLHLDNLDDTRICGEFFGRLECHLLCANACPSAQSMLMMASCTGVAEVNRYLIRILFEEESAAKAITATVVEDASGTSGPGHRPNSMQECPPRTRLHYHWADKFRGEVGITWMDSFKGQMFVMKSVVPPAFVWKQDTGLVQTQGALFV